MNISVHDVIQRRTKEGKTKYKMWILENQKSGLKWSKHQVKTYNNNNNDVCKNEKCKKTGKTFSLFLKS